MMRRRWLLAALLPATLAAQPQPLELNEAGRADLESLPGIGPALAERVLAARAGGGPFADWAALRRRVKGLGPASLRRLSAAGLRVRGRPYEADPESDRGPPGDDAVPQ